MASRFLLIDPQSIAEKYSVRQVVHQPRPYAGNPLLFDAEFVDFRKLAPDAAEESPHDSEGDSQHNIVTSDEEGIGPLFNANIYGRTCQVHSVIKSPLTGKIQLYYHVYGGINHTDMTWIEGSTVSCYAESDDGIHFTMPKLNKYRVFGTTENNIQFQPGDQPWIWLDHHDPDPQRRYKAYIHPGPCIMSSPDGIDWHSREKGTLKTDLGRSDGDVILGWEPRCGKYVCFFRPWKKHPDDTIEGKRMQRRIGHAVSDDLINWHDHRMVFKPDENDPPCTEIERMCVFSYEGLYLGLAHFVMMYGEQRWHYSHLNGRSCVQLCWSRDTIEWHRFESREPFLGPAWQGMTLPSLMPVDMGDELYFYYHNSPKDHGELPQMEYTHLAKMTKDRFVGWRADETEGYIQTPLFDCPGGELRVNADLTQGYMRVAVVMEDGMHDIEYAAYRCNYLEGSALVHTPRWWRRTNLDAFRGKKISLRYYLRNAEVFSYWFES